MSEKTANASEIIPQVKVLKHAITKAETDPRFSGIGSTIAAISRSMESRFLKYLENKNLILATVIDPRFKNTLYINSEDPNTNFLAIQNLFTQTLMKICSDKKEYEENSSSDSSLKDIQYENQNLEQVGIDDDIYDFNKCFNDLITSKPDNKALNPLIKDKLTQESSAAWKNEYDKYLSIKLEAHDVDPILWWKGHANEFPELRKIANKMLSSPPSSIESERLFSVGGNIFSSHRNRLNPQCGENLMLLNFNLRAFKFDY